MKLKTIHVPQGYDGLHLEVDGAIVNVMTKLTMPTTGCQRVRVSVSLDRYVGDPRPVFVDVKHDDSGAWILYEIPDGGTR